MKKNKVTFITIKKKWIILVIVCLIISSIFCFLPKLVASFSPKSQYTVVIDAGHGGKDGGSIGKELNTIEKEINLEYAFCLKDIMQQFSFNVVLTRSTDDGLYDESAPNKKRDDMKKRKQIIENSNADFVISIHMNSFPDRSACGAETYFCKGSEAGEKLANCIQGKFNKNLPKAKKTAKSGEFYMLEQIACPSVLIECGFLSNAEEEKRLNSSEYRNDLCYNILLGVLEYLQ